MNSKLHFSTSNNQKTFKIHFLEHKTVKIGTNFRFCKRLLLKLRFSASWTDLWFSKHREFGEWGILLSSTRVKMRFGNICHIQTHLILIMDFNVLQPPKSHSNSRSTNNAFYFHIHIVKIGCFALFESWFYVILIDFMILFLILWFYLILFQNNIWTNIRCYASILTLAHSPK